MAKFIQKKLIFQFLKPRNIHSHKGNHGKVLVIAGSIPYAGAALLAGEAALRSGAGLVILAVPETIYSAVAGREPSLIVVPCPALKKEGVFSQKASPILLGLVSKSDSVVLGPGLSPHSEVKKLCARILPDINIPCVIDANGLDVFQNRKLFPPKRGNWILTPHSGEFKRIFEVSVKNDDAKRLSKAKAMANKTQCTLVLKGHHSIIASPNGESWINPTGNALLATAGTGDVLSGLIGGFLAQKLTPLQAALAGVFLHGETADFLSKDYSRGIISSDLLKVLPWVLSKRK